MLKATASFPPDTTKGNLFLPSLLSEGNKFFLPQDSQFSDRFNFYFPLVWSFAKMSTTATTTLLVALAALFSLGDALPLKASEKPNSNSYKATPFDADDKSFRQGVMKLPAFNAVPNQTTISGLSSGAFFAVQMGVAFSSIIKGVGVFAGGPYHCALGNIMSAEENCMYALPPPDVPALVDITTHRSTDGVIDDISNLADQRVYMFTGTDDAVVRSSVVSSLYNYLTNFVKDVSQVRCMCCLWLIWLILSLSFLLISKIL
jgi:hypothetical protein